MATCKTYAPRNDLVEQMTEIQPALRQERTPDFCCIGAQKAGTTWLHENLRRDPRMWLPPVKELQYFNQLYIPQHGAWTQEHRNHHASQRLKNYARNNEELNLRYVRLLADITEPDISDAWYRSIFGYAPEDRLCGDMTPEYSLLPEAGVDHFKTLAPKAKIIMVLRDPIDRCWSHARMIYGRNSKADIDIDHIVKMQDIYERADYPKLIDRWLTKFPASQIHICFFDDIEAQPTEFLSELYKFLDRPFDPSFFPNLDTVVHKGKAINMPQHIYLSMKEQLEPIYENLRLRYPDYAKNWYARHY